MKYGFLNIKDRVMMGELDGGGGEEIVDSVPQSFAEKAGLPDMNVTHVYNGEHQSAIKRIATYLTGDAAEDPGYSSMEIIAKKLLARVEGGSTEAFASPMDAIAYAVENGAVDGGALKKANFKLNSEGTDGVTASFARVLKFNDIDIADVSSVILTNTTHEIIVPQILLIPASNLSNVTGSYEMHEIEGTTAYLITGDFEADYIGE